MRAGVAGGLALVLGCSAGRDSAAPPAAPVPGPAGGSPSAPAEAAAHAGASPHPRHAVADGVRARDTGPADGDPDDPDGDGWTAAEGDCAPRRARSFPGAPERCDGHDDDCDGLIDEPGGEALVHVREKNEGATWTATLWPTGCVQRAALAQAPPAAVAQCGLLDEDGVQQDPLTLGDPMPLTLSCTLRDEGPLALVVEISGPGGVAALALDGAVTNAPPEVVGDATPVSIQLEPTGDSGLAPAAGEGGLRRVFRAVDLGRDDAVRWSVEGGPPHMQIDQDGVLRFVPDEADLGAWRAVVRATDDAGDAGELALYVDVSRTEDADGGLGCCCFGATAALGLPAVSLLRRRRRGGRPPG